MTHQPEKYLCDICGGDATVIIPDFPPGFQRPNNPVLKRKAPYSEIRISYSNPIHICRECATTHKNKVVVSKGRALIIQLLKKKKKH